MTDVGRTGPQPRGRNGTLSAITPRTRDSPSGRGLPCHRGAYVVPGNHRLLGAQRVKQTHQVANMMKHRVCLDLLRTVGLTVTTQVARDRVESGLGERAKLMAPGVPGLGKPVTSDDQGAHALLGHVHADAVRLDDAMLPCRHR
jgi:hypothetical protein